MSKKNILLILTDQHRYDIVGINGSKLCKSPHIDAIAKNGVNFTNAYTISSVCTPARASMYTGLVPHRHGLTANSMAGNPNPRSIMKSTLTLAERMESQGYRSHLVGKWHAGERLPNDAGFTGMNLPFYGDVRNSDIYHDYLKENGYDIPKPDIAGTGWAHQLSLAGTMSGPVEASVPYFAVEKGIEYINEQDGDSPFFLSVNFWGPHAPYFPSEPYASMYNPDDIEPWGNFEDTFENKPPVYERYKSAFIGEGQPRRSWEECALWASLYFGYATQIDDQIGRLIDSLKKKGLYDNTVILFSTDHGDYCGAHGGMHDKGAIMSQSIYHIPLMGIFPGGQQGGTCDLPVSNLDLSKTILEVAGCTDVDDLDGCSLLPELKGEDNADRPDYIVSEFFGHHFAYETRMVVHNDYKYVYHPAATDELYQLKNDPWELTNLIDDAAHKGNLDDCRFRLLEWAKATNDDLCSMCGLFHERLEGAAEYTPKSMNTLRDAPTKLLKS